MPPATWSCGGSACAAATALPSARAAEGPCPVAKAVAARAAATESSRVASSPNLLGNASHPRKQATAAPSKQLQQPDSLEKTLASRLYSSNRCTTSCGANCIATETATASQGEEQRGRAPPRRPACKQGGALVGACCQPAHASQRANARWRPPRITCTLLPEPRAQRRMRVCSVSNLVLLLSSSLSAAEAHQFRTPQFSPNLVPGWWKAGRARCDE